jgi:glycosyltransferase involved in cell wall biosynthesis
MNMSPPVVMFLAKAFQTDPRPRHEARSLAKANHTVFVIAWDREHMFPWIEKVDGAVVHSLRSLNLRRPSALGLAVGAMLFQILLFLEYIKLIRSLAQRPIIHAHDLNTLVPGVLLRTMHLSAGLVYDCHELTYAAYSELFNPTTGQIARVIEENCVRHVESVITVSDPIASYLRRLNHETIVIYNCVNGDEMPNITRAEARVRLGLPRKAFVISSVGLMRYDCRLDLLLSVASLVNNDDFRFIFVGGGPLANMVEQTVQKSGDKRIIILPQVSRDLALLFVQASDLTWAVYQNPKVSLNSKIGMPWKFFESLAACVPVVVEDGSFRAELVRKLRCGVVLETDIPSRVTEAIVNLASNSVKLRSMRTATRKASAMMLNWNAMEKRLVSNYKRVERGICPR